MRLFRPKKNLKKGTKQGAFFGQQPKKHTILYAKNSLIYLGKSLFLPINRLIHLPSGQYLTNVKNA